MRVARAVAFLVVLAFLPGCYVAKIDTGLHPSTTVIKKSWASCWIYGLVPPSTVETAAKCPNGVAIVETQHSFLNQVVAGLTFGIYTPIQITVTCAERPATSMIDFKQDITIPGDATAAEIQAYFSRAADQAVRTHQPVVVGMAP